jgi:hypothetical protein
MYRKHDVILSFVDGVRASSLVDSTRQANLALSDPKRPTRMPLWVVWEEVAIEEGVPTSDTKIAMT